MNDKYLPSHLVHIVAKFVVNILESIVIVLFTVK